MRPTVITHMGLRPVDKMRDIETCDEAVGLLTTYRCNLNCKYCYISCKQNKDMSLEQAKEILTPILSRRAGTVDIVFMGGETLLAEKMVRSLVEWAVAGNWERDYRFFGSTNGTLLTEELKGWLSEYRDVVTLGLSYDGLPSVQKMNRGNRTDIDLEFFRRTWPHQKIQMTINAESVYSMADGVIFLLERGHLVNPNVAYEEKQWSRRDIREYRHQLAKLIDYYSEHPDTPVIPQFSHNLPMYAYCLEHPVEQMEQCGAGNGFWVYDVDGKRYPCHILSPLVLDTDSLERLNGIDFQGRNSFADANCYGCPYISACPTCIGCNFIYRGGIQNRDRTHCKIMRLEVQAYMKLEAMRLMKKKEITPEDALEVDAIKALFMNEARTRY